MVNWNNAPEWADRHGELGGHGRSVWYNRTKYQLYGGGSDYVGHVLPFIGSTLREEYFVNVTERPTTAHSINWNNAPEWATHHGFAGPDETGHWFGNCKYLPVGRPTYETMNDPTGELQFKMCTPRPDKVIGLVSDADVSFYESLGYITVVAGEKLAEAMAHPTSIYYIAGPMSGLPNFNRDAFNAAAAKLTAAGHTALNPATLPDGLSQAQYMDICLAMLRCATHVQMLRGWDDSRGAFAERALALKLGLIVEYL